MLEGLAVEAARTGWTGSCCCSCKSDISVGEARWSGPPRTASVPDSSATLSPVPPDSSATLSPIKKEKDRKEKVIGSWPGTCIQYTQLHYKRRAPYSCKTRYSWDHKAGDGFLQHWQRQQQQQKSHPVCSMALKSGDLRSVIWSKRSTYKPARFFSVPALAHMIWCTWSWEDYHCLGCSTMS